MKTIVTHIGPDLDAACAIWLIKQCIPGWVDAALQFVPAGKTLNDIPADSNSEIIHVDTGFGKFDHHQSDADTCASQLVLESLEKKDEALERLVRVVNDIDHFRECFFPNPTADFWDISLPSIIDGWRLLYADNPIKLVDLIMTSLDGAYKMFQNKVWAEHEIKEKAILFDTEWGKAFGIETVNDEVVHYGQKMGYVLVVRKDPNKKYLRIKAIPKKEVDLTPLYEILKKEDPEATWFLHASTHMILNGSTKNPEMKPTTLSLQRIIEITKGVV
ncbi:MAG: hypothetical protein UW37_C0039G0006 [Candidatus Gottesmanbacteria bacterium GW2011_GWA2_44_17]|uniref:ChrB C-terminal domain-containing protein n=2 Tax=Candidatus Gottesmaniibacteriota TaxID=1752720 RepID=A0A0G1KDD2_9BACT|nr:MAG: hypothetical protein UW22_C0053G0006 [Candidatus Gottesmanbacteria bacterium GW2011_GWB1_44_11c]KKT45839.1 MAG: hypothetical protein UW37_C0039G0006 [Candidatus Gottesmanbacteria bacterium GW2011_GWA2_44_17]